MSGFTRRDWLLASAMGGVGLIATRLNAAPASQQEGPPDAMVLIPAGPFHQGTSAEEAATVARQYAHHPTWLAGELPGRTIELSAFWIDKYPVTNSRYAEFVEATGHRVPVDWRDGKPPRHRRDHPVRYVDQEDARAFAAWAGRRLPTAAEWEKAARGTDGRAYPWGNEFDPKACHHDRGGEAPPVGTVPVTAHPLGASPYGVMDLAGNIAEYCEDGPGPGTAYIKGGCWLTASPLNLRCAAVGMSGASNNALDYLGFRCAKDA
jgi:formylglycine-generating enzyme required for sulfatase activity